MGRATKTARKRQSHQSVSMLYNQLEDESRPSTCELTVLVGWMLKAMYEQKEHMPEKPKKKKPWASHLVFPVRSPKLLRYLVLLLTYLQF